MQFGVIDLGPLGTHIVGRLLSGGHLCVVYDRCPRRVAELSAEKAFGAASPPDLVNELDAPRTICLAGPSATVDATIRDLLPHLEPEDIIIDCSDSYYVDDISRAADLAAARVHYVDVGISGSVTAPEQRYCLTIGGEGPIVRYLDPVFKLLVARPSRVAAGRAGATAAQGYLHCGPAGAGHFVSMIHNGIERCVTAACVEGFGILRGANVGRAGGASDHARCVTHPEHYQYDFRLREIAEVWRHSGVVASQLLDEAARALEEGTALVPRGSQAGRDEWSAVRAAEDEGVAVPVLSSVLLFASDAAPAAAPVAGGTPERSATSQAAHG